MHIKLKYGDTAEKITGWVDFDAEGKLVELKAIVELDGESSEIQKSVKSNLSETNKSA